MSEIISELLEVTVDTDATVEIDSKLPEVQVDITKSITAEIQPENYVLTSGGVYTGSLTGAVPTWILDAIQQQLTTGDGNITSVLDDMQLLLDSLQLGVNQAISQIENTNVSMSALSTSLSSQIGVNSADILDVYATRVTATEAQAIAVTTIGSTFNNNVDAYIANLASVYTAPGSATATNISTLQTSYNDQTARIDTVESVAIAAAVVIRSATAPTLISHPSLKSGDYWIDTANGNIEYVWNGLSWDETTTGSAEQAYTWSAEASKLITAPDGSVTGWSFGDGSNIQSAFNIYADSFNVKNPTTAANLITFNTIDNKIELTGKFITYSLDGNYYSVLDSGSLAFYKTGDSTPYKYLRQLQTGSAIPTGSTVTLNGFFDTVPNIMVSTNSLATYDPAYSDRMQVQNVGYSNLQGSTSTGTWTFTPIVELSLSASSTTIGSISNKESINYAGIAYNTSVITYTSSSITPTLTTKIDITGGTFYIRYYHYYEGSSDIGTQPYIVTLQTSTDNSSWTDRQTITANWSSFHANNNIYYSVSVSGMTTGTITANQYYYRLKFSSNPSTYISTRTYNWSGSDYCYLGTTGVTSYYTTTGTTILQSGYVNYIAIGK